MRRAVNILLLVLAIAAAAAGAAAYYDVFKSPAPPAALGALAGVLLLVLVIRLLPLRPRRVAVFLVTFLALAGLVGGVSYFQFVFKPGMVKKALSAAFAPKPTAVNVEPARLDDWTPELTAIGTLRAYQGVMIAPQVASLVSAIHFESGDDVKQGQLLVSLDDSVEQADLANGLAQLKNAEVTLERQKTLVKGGNTPQSSVDSAIATRDSAAATVQHARAIIAQKAIRAPFTGRLGLRNVDLGQFVSVGLALVSLQQLDPVYVDFSTPEDSLAALAVGERVEIAVDAAPGRKFVGKATAIDARVSADSRNITVRAEIANPDRLLLPGMFANVTVVTGQPVKALTVPRTAIVYSLYGDNVFALKPAGSGFTAEREFVEVGPVRGERVAIEKGLEEGQKVVTTGQIKLQNGSPIAVDETNALPAPAVMPKP